MSAAALVLVCLTFAVATDSTPAPANYVWFGAGLSFFMFSYSFILTIVKERITFFANCARDSNAKKSIGYLKLALFSYFGRNPTFHGKLRNCPVLRPREDAQEFGSSFPFSGS